MDYNFETMKAEIIDQCPICRGASLTCECHRKFSMMRRRVLSGVPLRRLYVDIKDVVDPKYAKQRKQIEEYIVNLEDNIKKGRGLYIFGPDASGKSYLSICVLNAASNNHSVMFVTRDKIMADIFAMGKDHMEQYVMSISKVDMLCLDNATFCYRTGREDLSFADYTYGRIMLERYNNMKPTITVSDKNLLDFKAYAKDRKIPLSPFEEGDLEVVSCARKGKI